MKIYILVDFQNFSASYDNYNNNGDSVFNILPSMKFQHCLIPIFQKRQFHIQVATNCDDGYHDLR